MNFFRGIVNLLALAGLAPIKFIAGILNLICGIVVFLFSEIFSLLKGVFRDIFSLVRFFSESFRHRVNMSNELLKNIRSAKKQGGEVYRNAVAEFIGSFLFGEEGVFYTAFNYIMPVVSVIFLIGVIKYGSGLEYGIAVEYNGRELGIISAEADFDEAQQEVQKRISYLEGDETVRLNSSASFSLKIISDTDRYVSSVELANEMLSSSNQELAEGWGIYVDGEFIGAVQNKDRVEDTLIDRLINYDTGAVNVRDVSYVNKVEYKQGIYLTDSMMEDTEAIKLLTSSKDKKTVYVAQQGDTPVTISRKFNMELEDFQEMNPIAKTYVTAGQMLNVVEHESFLPIQYIRDMETLSFLDYETMETETSSLNVGVKEIIVKGVKGEKVSNVEITYVDGIEKSRKTLSSKITREPVMEQIGIGIYSAKPASSDTVLSGTGEFGWPVDGGWISDTFISNRNHQGLDIAADMNTEIYAAEEGTVIASGWNSGGYGNVVMIDHGNGYQTLYAHMNRTAVLSGQTVSKGQLIGYVGSTGDSSGPHCHFEVRYNGVCHDPASYLNTSG